MGSKIDPKSTKTIFQLIAGAKPTDHSHVKVPVYKMTLNYKKGKKNLKQLSHPNNQSFIQTLFQN